MVLLLPVFMDCILALRLSIVYPRAVTPLARLMTIFTPVVVLKIVRLANLIVFLVKFTDAVSGETAASKFQTFWDSAPWNKIEAVLQVFDNWYLSHSTFGTE
jgi:hypothetical protein